MYWYDRTVAANVLPLDLAAWLVMLVVHKRKRSMYAQPETRPLEVFDRLPERYAKPRQSRWADINLAGHHAGCFLEGPDFDQAGNLYVVDIPFGRIFRRDTAGQWHLVIEYDGWPNGLKLLPDGRLLVADFRRGLVRVDPASGSHEVLFDSIDGQPLHGLNDLTFGPDGTLYITDQGQTGLHDPRGRVLRMTPDGSVSVLLNNGPSPNGLVFDHQKPWLYVAMTRGNAIWRVPLFEGEPVKVGIAVQLSGGIGPDGIAMDAEGRLLVAHMQIGVWHFDARNRPLALYEAPADSYTTNLAVRDKRIYVTDSIQGRILTAALVD